jgi:hypothetical protein
MCKEQSSRMVAKGAHPAAVALQHNAYASSACCIDEVRVLGSQVHNSHQCMPSRLFAHHYHNCVCPGPLMFSTKQNSAARLTFVPLRTRQRQCIRSIHMARNHHEFSSCCNTLPSVSQGHNRYKAGQTIDRNPRFALQEGRQSIRVRTW